MPRTLSSNPRATIVALCLYILWELIARLFIFRKRVDMPKKDLKYFMRNEEVEIVKVPGPESFKDDEGNVIELEIKILSYNQINDIYDQYTDHKMVTDTEGRPMVNNGNEVIWKTEKDTQRAVRHIVAEALQYPDLKDPQLMEFYNCYDISEMPLKVFNRADEYNQVVRVVSRALGLTSRLNNKDELKAAKN